MRQGLLSFVAIFSIMLAAGCGTQSMSDPAAAGTPSDPIARVVYEFLEAVRVADAAKANQFLTPEAVKQTSAQDMAIVPPGSPTASFRLGATKVVDSTRAVVETVWIDVDTDGTPVEQNTTWALKLIGGVWRISGMAAEIGPGQEPFVFNFEDPNEIRRLQQASQSGQTTETPLQAAQPPQDPFRTVPR
jgi:hypothetical protein